MLLPCTTVEVSSVRMNNVAVFLERDGKPVHARWVAAERNE